jgi:hypothetical protein
MTTPAAQHGPWVAVINWGRWVVECPRPRCSYAYAVTPGQEARVCQTNDGEGCGYMAPIEWPREAAALTVALADRPVEQDRNWAPAGHPQTFRSITPGGQVVALAFPEGQGLKDIRAENRELEMLPPKVTPRDEVVEKANAALAELGFAYNPDNPGQLRRL